MERPGVTMEIGNDGVAVISIFNPPVNSLAIRILAGIKERFEEALKRDDVKAIVVFGKGGKFSGGFDINVFGNVHKTGDNSILPDVSIDLLLNTIGESKKPAVAALGGLALGGGLELAMACHARVAVPKAQLGLPELTLGVIPGFGGTQLLPRLVGLSKAIEIMLLSKSIMSEEGKKLGLIDEIASSSELLNVSRVWALDIAERRKSWMRTLLKSAFAGRTFESSLVDILIKNGRNGKSNGKGYYIYQKGSKPKPDLSVLPIIEESRKLANVMPGGKPISVSDSEIVEMILFPVVNESCRVLDEGIVIRASDLDVASVLMSFPTYRGGILFWGDLVGADYINRSLKKWSEAYGDFYKPSQFLEERATRGIPLNAPKTTASASKSRL